MRRHVVTPQRSAIRSEWIVDNTDEATQGYVASDLRSREAYSGQRCKPF